MLSYQKMLNAFEKKILKKVQMNHVRTGHENQNSLKRTYSVDLSPENAIISKKENVMEYVSFVYFSQLENFFPLIFEFQSIA